LDFNKKKMQTASCLNYADKKVCVLMGHCGVGKTTIFNKVCGTKRLAKYSEDSLTRGLAISDASYGDFPFTVIDTPGDDPNV